MQTFKKIVDRNDFYINMFYEGEQKDYENPNTYYHLLDIKLDNIDSKISFDDLLEYIRDILHPFKEKKFFLNLVRSNEDITILIVDGVIEEYKVCKKSGIYKDVSVSYYSDISSHLQVSVVDKSTYDNGDIKTYIDETLIPCLVKKIKKGND